jgi:predicted O-methyltransferase YrrM
MDYNDILQRGNRRMTAQDLALLERQARRIGARTLVEIGAMDGCSTLLLGTLAREYGGRLTSVEPRPRGRWRENVAAYGLADVVVSVRAFSPWIERSAVPVPIDLLLIDGDHRASRALADYVFWGRFVRAGGVIAFHDIDGGKGVAHWIRAAVAIAERDDNLACEQGPDYRIRPIDRTPEARDRGTVAFEKDAEAQAWPTFAEDPAAAGGRQA